MNLWLKQILKEYDIKPVPKLAAPLVAVKAIANTETEKTEKLPAVMAVGDSLPAVKAT